MHESLNPLEIFLGIFPDLTAAPEDLTPCFLDANTGLNIRPCGQNNAGGAVSADVTYQITDLH